MKKKLLLISLLVTILIIPNKVSALTINGSDFTTSTIITLNANNNRLGPFYLKGQFNETIYGHVALCSGAKILTLSSPSFKDISAENSSVTCTFPGRPDMVGNIIDVYYSYTFDNEQYCYTTWEGCSQTDYFTFNANAMASYTLLSSEYSLIPYDRSNADSTIINQNQTIINQNNQALQEEQKQTGFLENVWNGITSGFNSTVSLLQDMSNKILDILKAVFIPSEDAFSSFFNGLSTSFEVQLGFLSSPFTIVLDFLDRFYQLSSDGNFILNIPSYTIPGFDVPIWGNISYNLRDVLERPEIYELWQLYLDFIDVFIILNFVNFCYNKLQHIISGEQTMYNAYKQINDNSADPNDRESSTDYLRRVGRR